MTDEDDGDGRDSDTSETRELTVSRVVEAPPERVYQAFVDPDELAQWMHPPGADCTIHHLDADEGGTYRITMNGETPDGTEYSHTYGGTFEELDPGERIVRTSDTDEFATIFFAGLRSDSVRDLLAVREALHCGGLEAPYRGNTGGIIAIVAVTNPGECDRIDGRPYRGQ